MSRSYWALAVTALTFTVACGRGERSSAAADSAAAGLAAAEAAAAASTGPAQVEGFEAPESAKYDAELDVWYVSNINGSPVAKDGNGYISRLKGDGTVDSLKWIVGGANGVKLDGPKGMALQGDTLWVADITSVRGFNRRTGVPVASISVKGSKFLNDIAVGSDGLYVTDSGLEGSAKGVEHTGPDRIYRIAPNRAVSVAIQSDSLAGPNGIAWDGPQGRFIVVPFAGTVIRAWTPGAKTTVALGPTKGQLDGVELLDEHRLLVTSWADSSLFVFENGTVTPVANGLPSPADIGVDTKRNRVAIPLLLENRIEFRALPAAGPAQP
jgi:sugar lactone lactonase YvrE